MTGPDPLSIRQEGERVRKQEVSPDSVSVCGGSPPSAAALSAGMVERVAQAISVVDFRLPGAGGLRGTLHVAPSQATELARAAIEAMREPTDEMLRAALAVQKPATYREHLRHPENGPLSARQTEEEIANERKRQSAVIDAALAPGQPSRAPQPCDQQTADDASGMTKDQEIADLKRRLSLAKERLPSGKPRGPDLSEMDGDWRYHPEAP